MEFKIHLVCYICILCLVWNFTHSRKTVIVPETRINKEKFISNNNIHKVVRVEDNFFQDVSGSIMQFHGLNFVLKSPPWYPEVLLNETNIKALNSYGFNVIRLGVMWTAVMPEENLINHTYINMIEDIVQLLGRHGIYVILDMHQDVLSSLFGTYDGAPLWLVQKLPQPSMPFPWPLKAISSWADGYLTDATGKAFQGIYDNFNGTRDILCLFWKTVAETFKTYTNVLGYEIINEPWAGDIYSFPTLLLPGVAGQKNLQILYKHVTLAIREHDNETMIFYEPVTWGIYFNNGSYGSGFSHVPGGAKYQRKSVFSYHYYCWLLGGADAHRTYPAIKKIVCDNVLGKRAFKTVQKDVKRLGGGSFLTEFGLCGPDGKNDSTSTQECGFVLNMADRFMASWTYWGSDDFQVFFNFTEQQVKPFARIFARRIWGHPIKSHFNVINGTFYLRYVPGLYQKGRFTEIFISKLYVPRGFEVVSPRCMKTYYVDAQSILYVAGCKISSGAVTLYIKPLK